MKRPSSNVIFTRGWIVVAAAFTTMFFTGPGQTYSFALFLDSIIGEFGWSRTFVSSLYSAATITSGLLMFLVGRQIDRFGSRKVILVSVFSLGIACLFLSFVFNPAMLFTGFFMARFFGQGSLGMASGTVAPQWFLKRRAMAIMIVGLGNTVAGSVFPLLNHFLIDKFAWRNAFRFLAAGLWFIAIPIVYLFIVSRPEDLGLKPDGARTPNGQVFDAETPVFENSIRQEEAIRMPVLWILAYAFFQYAMVGSGVAFHFVSILSDRGYSSAFAAGLMSISPIAGISATIITGLFLDRLRRPQYVLAIACAIQVITKILLAYLGRNSTAILYSILNGSSGAILALCIAVLKPYLFGPKYLGGISGAISVIVVIGSALGPLYFGAAYDRFGGYTGTLLISAMFPALALVAALLIRKPEFSSNPGGTKVPPPDPKR